MYDENYFERLVPMSAHVSQTVDGQVERYVLGERDDFVVEFHALYLKKLIFLSSILVNF